MTLFDPRPISDDDTFGLGLPDIAAQPTATPLEALEAEYNRDRMSFQSLSAETSNRNYWTPILDRIEEVTGQRPDRPDINANRKYDPVDQFINQHAPWWVPDTYATSVAAINTLIEEYPELSDLKVLSSDEHISAVEQMAIDAERVATEQNRTFLGEAAGFLGSIGADARLMIQDPLYGAINIIGGGAARKAGSLAITNISRAALFEGLLNVGIEGSNTPAIAAWRDRVGLKYDAETIGMQLGGAFVGGAAFGGAIATPLELLARRGDTPGAILGQEMNRAIDEMSLQDIHEKILGLSDREIGEGLKALQDDGVELPPVARGAQEELQAQEDLFDDNPLDDELEHMRRALDADAAIRDEDVAPLPEQPAAPIKAQDINEADNLDGVLFRFDPQTIEADAKTFQYKSDGDEFGVTDKYRNTMVWDPSKAGQVIVYEYADGRRVIADGHQRLGMAKRIMAADPSQKPVLYGTLLREVDGVLPEEAMVIAARKNITEAVDQPGSKVLDAAKLERQVPGALDDPSLPVGTTLIRQARDLVDLSDIAFGAVINGVVPTNYAAIVGRLVKDQDKQIAVMQLLADAEPANVTQAEAIVRQALEAEFDTAVQVGLFGEELVTESLFKERARVLDAALKTLKRDRTVFRSLVENRSRIEGEGNVLAMDQNQSRSEIDGQAIQLVQTVANRRGPLSDALTAAARDLKETGNAGRSSGSFVDAVRDAVARGDFDGADVGDAGRAIDVEAEGNRLAASPGREELAVFDDPDGPAVKQQADQLEQDFVGAEPPRDPDAIGPDYRDYLEPTPDSIEIARDDIVPIRARPEGIANARKFMAQAAVGETDKRGPLTVKDNGDGTYTLLDGNSTYAVASEAGMETLPVRVVTDEQFAKEVAQKNAEKMLELGPDAKKKRVVLAQDLELVELRRLAATLQSRQAYTSIDDIVSRNNAFNGELNAVVKRAAGEHKIDYRPGPPKERGRIETKINDKYRGKLNRIADASRATVTVTRPDEADAFIKELGKTYHIVDEGYKGAPAGTEAYSGYFDKKLMVINDDGVIGEVIIIERGLFDAKHSRGGHKLYEIARGDEDLDKAFAGIPDEALRSRLEALRDDRPALEAAANQAMIELYESVLPQIDASFGQVVGNVLRSPPNTAISVSNSAAVNSSVRVSDSSSLAEISPQVPSSSSMNALPSSRSTVGYLPSSEKNLIDQTSGDSVTPAPQNYNTETGPQGEQTLIPGVEPVTDAQRAQLEVDRPMRGGDRPMDVGLFDTDAQAQTDLLDLVPMSREAPDGSISVEEVSRRQLLDEIDRDQKMIDRFAECVV